MACWSCGGRIAGEAPYRTAWADYCCKSCYLFPCAVSGGKVAPDPWPPRANGKLDQIPWPRPNFEWLDAIRDRRGRMVRSKIDASSARQTLAEARLGVDEVNALREGSAAIRMLEGLAKGEEPDRTTLRSAGDEGLAFDVWGSRGGQPGTGDRGLVEFAPLDESGAGVAGAHLRRVRQRRVDGWDELAADDESEVAPSDLARDRQAAREAMGIVDGGLLLSDDDPADGRAEHGRGRPYSHPVLPAGVSIEWRDPVFDAVRVRLGLLEVEDTAVLKAVMELPPREFNALLALVWRPPGAKESDPLGAEHFDATGEVLPDSGQGLDYLALRDDVDLATVYRRKNVARAKLRDHPEVVRRHRKPSESRSWAGHPGCVAPPKPTWEPYWAHSRAESFHFTEKNLPETQKTGSHPAPIGIEAGCATCQSPATTANGLCVECDVAWLRYVVLHGREGRAAWEAARLAERCGDAAVG